MPDTAYDGQPYVFISYASADRERVLRVVDALTQAGISVWRDQDDITGGTAYGPAIASAIRGSGAVLVLCSDASLASRNVRQEVAIAWKHERPCLPLLLDPMTVLPEEVEYWLEGAQWIEVLDHPVETWLPKGAMRYRGSCTMRLSSRRRQPLLPLRPVRRRAPLYRRHLRPSLGVKGKSPRLALCSAPRGW